MEAVSRTATELRLELKGARRQRLAAAVFLGAGILVALLLGWRTRLRCFPWEEAMSPAEALRDGWCVVRRENLWMWSERSVQMAHIRAALLDGSGLASRVTLIIMPKGRYHRRPTLTGQLQTSGEVREASDDDDPSTESHRLRNEISARNDTDATDAEAEPLLSASTSDRVLAEDARLADGVGRKEHGAPGEDDSIRELPLTHYYSLTGYASKQRIKPSADGEIATDDAALDGMILDEEIDDRWFAYGCAVLFASVFVVLLFISKREVCIIDKSENVLAIIRNNVWGRQEEVYNWQDVGLVEIHRATQNRKTDFNVFFNIEPFSSWVPLSQHGTYASEEEAEEICSEIRDFIGIRSWQNLLQLKKLS